MDGHRRPTNAAAHHSALEGQMVGWRGEGHGSGQAQPDHLAETLPWPAVVIGGPVLDEAVRFYGPSIDFSVVITKDTRIARGGRPWTANNTIRFPGLIIDLSTLIHELAHVWQYQNGNMQLLKGLVEQIGHGVGRDPYEYGGAAGLREAVATNTPLMAFSNESQAQIIQDYWSSQNGGTEGYGGDDFDAAYMENMGALVSRAGIGTRAPRGANRIESVVGRLVNGVLGFFKQ